MKWKKMMTMLIGGACSFGLSSCSSSSNNDDGNSGGDDGVPGQAVETAFWAKYPEATGVEWEGKGDFRQADFKLTGVDYETWYNKSGVWLLSEHTLAYASLPQAVKTSVTNSINYPPASWTAEDNVEVLEISNVPVWYGVELKNGQEQVTVWYYANGNGIRDVIEDYEGDEIPGQISSFISSDYPKAITWEVEKFANGSFDAIILDGEQVKFVYFNRSYTWLYTSWFVIQAQVPQVVLNVLSNEAYQGYTIEQIQFQQYPSGSWYHFSLAKTGSANMTVNIDAQGNLVMN